MFDVAGSSRNHDKLMVLREDSVSSTSEPLRDLAGEWVTHRASFLGVGQFHILRHGRSTTIQLLCIDGAD